MRRTARIVAGIMTLVLLGGCASPAWRIRRNPDVFGSLPPGVQERVRKGKIEPGDSQDAVFIAMGRPHHVYERVTAAGTSEIWTYSGFSHTTRFVPVDASYVYRDRKGEPRIAYGWSLADVGYREESQALRVEFAEGKVVAIESLRR